MCLPSGRDISRFLAPKFISAISKNIKWLPISDYNPPLERSQTLLYAHKVSLDFIAYLGLQPCLNTNFCLGNLTLKWLKWAILDSPFDKDLKFWEKYNTLPTAPAEPSLESWEHQESYTTVKKILGQHSRELGTFKHSPTEVQSSNFMPKWQFFCVLHVLLGKFDCLQTPDFQGTVEFLISSTTGIWSFMNLHRACCPLQADLCGISKWQITFKIQISSLSP